MILENKNIVIVGGTTGIGLSAAKAFIEHGANIVVVGRNEESVITAKKILGNNAEAISADAIDRHHVTDMLAAKIAPALSVTAGAILRVNRCAACAPLLIDRERIGRRFFLQQPSLEPADQLVVNGRRKSPGAE